MADRITLRPVTETDLVRLEIWLALPHVRRWWGEPANALATAAAPPAATDQAMITLNGSAVGYLRWAVKDRATLDAVELPEIPAGSVDVDIFIGEADALYRGVGPAALRLLKDKLFANPPVPLIGLVTSVDNRPALRAYAKAGFSVLRSFDDPTFGPCWLLVAKPEITAD